MKYRNIAQRRNERMATAAKTAAYEKAKIMAGGMALMALKMAKHGRQLSQRNGEMAAYQRSAISRKTRRIAAQAGMAA